MIPTENEVRNLVLMWREYGYTWKMIGENLKVSDQTARRWAAGQHIATRNRIAAGKYSAELQKANAPLFN